jgi:hypothetical protein
VEYNEAIKVKGIVVARLYEERHELVVATDWLKTVGFKGRVIIKSQFSDKGRVVAVIK